MKQLIVTADDLGLSFGVVTGIVEAHRRGIVTAASAMVQAPAWDQAVAAAKQTPRLAVGLHFVLTAGRPVGDGTGLGEIITDDGRFRRLTDDKHASVTEDGVARELEAQLRMFRNEIGQTPTHIDSHHHVHAVPQVLGAVLDVARDGGFPVRACSEAVADACDEASVRMTGRFINDFYEEPETGRSVSVENLCDIIDSLSPGIWELMCHPAHPDPLLRKLSSYHLPRTAELKALIDPVVQERIASNGVRLVNPGETRD